jgi:hypothetical protein
LPGSVVEENEKPVEIENTLKKSNKLEFAKKNRTT